MTWRDLCEEFARHRGALYSLQRSHYTEAQREAGDALMATVEAEWAARQRAETLQRENSGLRDDMARMTELVERLEAERASDILPEWRA